MSLRLADHDGSSRLDITDSSPQLRENLLEARKTNIVGAENNDTDLMLRDVLLMAKTLIRRYEHVECRRAAPK